MCRDCHLLLIGPTVMGKCLVYMLPATQHEFGITCVLLPLSALHLDFTRRCQKLKIKCSHWLLRTNEQLKMRIMFMSPEHTQTVAFSDYLVGMSRLGLLAQLVIDEVHLLKLHSDFRFCLSALEPLVCSGECRPVDFGNDLTMKPRCSVLVDDCNLSTTSLIRTIVLRWDHRLPHYSCSHGPSRNWLPCQNVPRFTAGKVVSCQHGQKASGEVGDRGILPRADILSQQSRCG